MLFGARALQEALFLAFAMPMSILRRQTIKTLARIEKNIRIMAVDKKYQPLDKPVSLASAREGFFDEKSITPAKVFVRRDGYLLFYYAKNKGNYRLSS